MTQTEQIERRSSARQRVFLGAKLAADTHFEPFECVVRNLNADGARIVVSGNAKLPATFRLTIPSKQCVLRARVVWRDGDTLGIYFDGFEFGTLSAGANVMPDTGARWRH